MNITCQGYKLIKNSKSNDDDFIEITMKIQTNFTKPDYDNIKIYINEIIEDVKSYEGSLNSNKYLNFGQTLKRIGKFLVPLNFYSSYKFFNRFKSQSLIKANLNSITTFQKMKINFFSFNKSMLCFLGGLFVANFLLNCSSQVPLIVIKNHLKEENKEKAEEKFKSYLDFRARLNNITQKI